MTNDGPADALHLAQRGSNAAVAGRYALAAAFFARAEASLEASPQNSFIRAFLLLHQAAQLEHQSGTDNFDDPDKAYPLQKRACEIVEHRFAAGSLVREGN